MDPSNARRATWRHKETSGNEDSDMSRARSISNCWSMFSLSPSIVRLASIIPDRPRSTKILEVVTFKRIPIGGFLSCQPSRHLGGKMLEYLLLACKYPWFFDHTPCLGMASRIINKKINNIGNKTIRNINSSY